MEPNLLEAILKLSADFHGLQSEDLGIRLIANFSQKAGETKQQQNQIFCDIYNKHDRTFTARSLVHER